MTHDRIYLFNSKNTFLDLSVGKKWVDESYTDETTNTMAYYGTLGQKISDKWYTWAGYYREKYTSNLFDYDQPDMERELRNGISYKPDDKNTFTIVNRYDTGKHEITKLLIPGRTVSAAGQSALNISRSILTAATDS